MAKIIKEQIITNEEANNYILKMGQQIYADFLEVIRIKELQDIDKTDTLFSLLIRYIKFQIDLPNIKMLFLDFNNANELILNSLNKYPKHFDNKIKQEDLEEYKYVLSLVPIEIFIVKEKDKFFIPVSYEQNKYGNYVNVWLKNIPISELDFIYNNSIHKNFNYNKRLGNEFQDLTQFETLRCDNKDCFKVSTNLYSLYYIAKKYNQYEKVLNNKTYIMLLKEFYIAKMESFIKPKLSNLKTSDVITYDFRSFKTEIHFQNLCLLFKLLTTKYKDVNHNFCKRFLKFLRQEFRNGDTIEQMYKFIKGYVNREWNFVAKDLLLECFPFLESYLNNVVTEAYQTLFILEKAEDLEKVIDKTIRPECVLESENYKIVLNKKIKP